MPSFNDLIVNAFYRVELDRVPDAAERAHWVSMIEAHGSALFAEHIVSSPEAAAVRQKRAQRVALASLERREANLAEADRYFAELAREIAVAPTAIAITVRAAAGLPADQIDRLRSSPTIRLVEHPAPSPAMIRVCDATELDASPAPETAVVAFLGLADPARTLARACYRVQFAELVHRRLSAMCLPVNMRLGGSIDLRTPIRRDGTTACPAFLLNADDGPVRVGPERAARALARATLHHFLSGLPARCLTILDDWDLAMGTHLARDYKAFAGLVADVADRGGARREPWI